MPRTAILDGDVIAFTAAAAIEKPNPFSPGEKEPDGDLQDAFKVARNMVHKWTDGALCSAPHVVIGGVGNFRRDLYPAYKSNRTGGKPEAYGAVVEFLRETFTCVTVDGIEGDDAAGIMVTNPRFRADRVNVTIDKDAKTLPSWIYNPQKDDKPWEQSELEADRWMFQQALMGDSTDGYPGCPGIGPKKATSALKGHTTADGMWAAVLKRYGQSHLYTAITMVQLARILRHEDWNKETKEIRLWHPTTPVWRPIVPGERQSP